MVNKTALIYTNKYQSYNFGPQHPLRPLRIKLTYSLMEKLNLFNNERLEVFEPSPATQKDIERAHDPEYVEIVKKLSDNPMDRSIQPSLYGLSTGDTPVFKGMYEASALVCGASLLAADKVWQDNDITIAFNPAGGLHHAHKNKASGFCIFNDIAVAIHHLKNLKKILELRIWI